MVGAIRTRSLILLAVGMALSGQSIGAVAPGAAEAGTEPPVAFTVQIPAAVEASSIGVSVSPDTDAEDSLQDGESIDLLPLAEGVSLSGDRTLTVRVDPASLPDTYVEADGVSTFEVVALGDAGSSTWSKVVSPQAVSTPDGAAWAVPEEVPAETTPTDGRRRAGAPRLVAVDGPTETLRAGSLVRLAGTEARSRTTSVHARAASTAAGNCVGPQPRKVKAGSKTVWVTIGTTYPIGGNTAATMQVDSSKGATYGIAASGSGAFGSWRADGSRSVSGSWGFIWDGSSSSRAYRLQVKYYRYKYEYLDSRCNNYKWVPILETGGTSSVTGIERPGFTHCAPVDKGEWYRSRSDGRSYQFGTAVKFAEAIGLDLSVNRQYSKSQRLKYHVVGPKQMCGNNAEPSIAGKVMEANR